MEWYIYLIIALGSLIALIIIALSILCIKNNKKNKDNLKQEDEVFNKIIEYLGGYNNINDVNLNSSRLSISLNDSSCLNNNEFIDYLKDKGIGLVKASKKITLVIGDLASKYYKEINNQISK